MAERKHHENPHISSGFKIYGAMTLGLSTAVAFRALIVIDHLWPDWVRPVWYFAVLGNFFFFWHRFQISQKRKHAISDYQLIAKVESACNLAPDEREALSYLFQSIKRSPENINYLIISCFSLVAIAADLLLKYFFGN